MLSANRKLNTHMRLPNTVMNNIGRVIASIALTLLVLSGTPLESSDGGQKFFAFVNSQLIITTETASSHSCIVNFINLSDFVIVTQPNEYI